MGSAESAQVGRGRNEDVEMDVWHTCQLLYGFYGRRGRIFVFTKSLIFPRFICSFL